MLEVYAEQGWSGFTIHAVATRSKVGKAAIYRRWPSKEVLIVETMMHHHGISTPAPNTGSVRGDLIEVAWNELSTYLRPDGLVILRAQVEAKLYPDILGIAMERWRVFRRDSGREIIRRAIDRGELPQDVDPTLLLDAIGGMIINHFIATPEPRLAELRANGRQLAERVTDFALAGLSSTTH